MPGAYIAVSLEADVRIRNLIKRTLRTYEIRRKLVCLKKKHPQAPARTKATA